MLLPAIAPAGTVSGTISLPSSGQGIANGTLTFSLTQSAVLAGTATLATNPASCYTDASGNVVGVPNLLVTPAPSQNLGSGTLAAGTYFYRVTYFNATGESAASPENSFTIGGTGTLIIAAPPARSGATGYNVYISPAGGAETRQGSVTGFASNYSQASALVAGVALPASNTSVCSVFFNDQLTPSYTGYNVNLVNSAGAQVGGFPQKWYLSGGANGTVNVGQGTPLYSGIVVYPQAIVGTPIANAQQSINGPLTLNGFPMTAGAYVSSSANPSGTGLLRGSATDFVTCMRNAANTADDCMADAGAASAATGNLADLLLLSGFGGYQGGAFVDRSAAPAQSGVERTGNNVCAVASRNAAGTGDVCAVQIDGSNVTNVGGSAGAKFSGPVNATGQTLTANASTLGPTTATSLAINGDTAQSKGPHFLVGAAYQSGTIFTANQAAFTRSQSTVIEEIHVFSPTTNATCSVSPTVSLANGSSTITGPTVSLTSGTNEWATTTLQTYNAGDTIYIKINAGTCTTAPTNLQVLVTGRMN